MIEKLQFGMNDFIALIPEIILCTFALLILIYDFILNKKDKKLVSYFTLTSLFVTLIAVLSLIGKSYTAYSGMFVLDNFGIFLKTVILIIAILSVAISHKYITDAGYESGEYYVLIMFSVIGMMIMSSAADLITMFVGLELMAIPCYFLTGIFKKEQRSVEGALKYFLMGAFSSAILAYGISFVYGITRTTNLYEIAKYFAAPGANLNNPVLYLVLILFVAGFGFKIAAVPFHMWCPDVYEGAPTPITAFMSTAVKAASFAMFLRVYATSLVALHINWAPTLAVLAALTMTIGNIVALTQRSFKRLLAYSSIAHAGYILIGLIAVKVADGVSSVLFYLLVYSFINIGPFIIIILLKTKNTSGEMLSDLHGLSKREPILAALLLVFMFALTGLPPTAGFVGKYYLFLAAVKAKYVWLTIVACINTAISAYYYFKVGMLIYMYEPKSDENIPKPAKPVLAALYTCAAMTIIIGIMPGPFLNAVQKSIIFFAN
jgi:NADH-quinone oxidoreductase subunit N